MQFEEVAEIIRTRDIERANELIRSARKYFERGENVYWIGKAIERFIQLFPEEEKAEIVRRLGTDSSELQFLFPEVFLKENKKSRKEG